MGFLSRFTSAWRADAAQEEAVEPHIGRDSAFTNISEPRASFTVTAIETDGRIRVEFDWNETFITKINALGYQADTQEDTVRMFFYASSMRPEYLSPDIQDLASPALRLSEGVHRIAE